MAELPRLGRTARASLVPITSLRHLHRLTMCSLLVSLASLTMLLWKL
jgi:hypothetical protein